ncbi:uncharacterized protein LOC130052772 [Ostrea edulis]|uniref:uncharacterized protein LOC130052772 n=1 Tax=Ostrea edulis TaxID=37623 RepID=UPI0024AEC3D2|nr:uncharacterized protein LOC130052772 [Ostrea edulis]
MIRFSWMLVCVLLAHDLFGSYGLSQEDDWQLVFHAVKGNKQDVRDAWYKRSPSRCTPAVGCIPDGFDLDNWRDTKKHLRSPLIDQWRSLSILKIRVVLGGQGKTLAYLEFDGSGSSFINWFSKSRLLHSSWYDLKPNSRTNFFSIAEHHAHVKRHFYINRNYGGCPNDAGWFVVIDKKDVCRWANKGVFPLFMYSKGSGLTNWNRSPGFADVMNVYIQTV